MIQHHKRTKYHNECMYIQDSPLCRRMLGMVLKSMSISFEEAEDGQTAIDMVERSLISNASYSFSRGSSNQGKVLGYCTCYCTSFTVLCLLYCIVVYCTVLYCMHNPVSYLIFPFLPFLLSLPRYIERS